MSADILGAVSHRDKDQRRTYHGKNSNYASGPYGTWDLQRLPSSRGLWYVQMHIRGLCVCCAAVQDDFGDLQMVKV